MSDTLLTVAHDYNSKTRLTSMATIRRAIMSTPGFDPIEYAKTHQLGGLLLQDYRNLVELRDLRFPRAILHWHVIMHTLVYNDDGTVKADVASHNDTLAQTPSIGTIHGHNVTTPFSPIANGDLLFSYRGAYYSIKHSLISPVVNAVDPTLEHRNLNLDPRHDAVEIVSYNPTTSTDDLNVVSVELNVYGIKFFVTPRWYLGAKHAERLRQVAQQAAATVVAPAPAPAPVVAPAPAPAPVPAPAASTTTSQQTVQTRNSAAYGRISRRKPPAQQGVVKAARTHLGKLEPSHAGTFDALVEFINGPKGIVNARGPTSAQIWHEFLYLYQIRYDIILSTPEVRRLRDLFRLHTNFRTGQGRGIFNDTWLGNPL